MNKADILKCISLKTGKPMTEINVVLSAFVECVIHSVAKGEKVSFNGFGTFSARKRKARVGRNPATGAPIKIAEKNAACFSPSKNFKEAVNKDKKKK